MATNKRHYFTMFSLLMWKNFLLQVHKPSNILYQVVFTALACSVIALLRYTIQHETGPGNVYEPFCVFNQPWDCPPLQKDVLEKMSSKYLAYSPKNAKIVQNLMQNFEPMFKGLKPYKNKILLESIYKSKDVFAGIEFSDDLVKKQSFPSEMDIAIRFPSKMDDNNDEYWCTDRPHEKFYEVEPPRANRSPTAESPNYYKTGFLTLQQALVYFLIPNASRNAFPRLYMRRSSYGTWTIESLTKSTMEVIINVIFFLHIIPFSMTIKHFANENETRLMVFMEVKRLPKWLQWFSWFVTSFIISLLIPVMITVILKVNWRNGSVFSYIQTPYVFLLLLLYLCSLITCAFLISLCFSSGFLATIVGVALFILSAIPFDFILTRYDILEEYPKYILSLYMNNALAYGFRTIIYHEGTQNTIKWSNLWVTDEKYTISFGVVLIMLLVDTLLYALLALYVDAIFPGKYGIARPWYLFRKKSKGPDPRELPRIEQPILQKEPSHLEVGIYVRNLSKSFGTYRVLRNIHLKVYKGEPTVLIGHSGSGKSILVRLLIGLYQPTSGTVFIRGYDVRQDLINARASMGACFQGLLLFADLSPKEHLMFYTAVNTGSWKASKAEVHKLLEYLELDLHADHKVKYLTTGAKRKLCIGIAFCGNPEVVILDEPTTGLDPSTTRKIWNFIQTQSADRTILIMTYNPEEAEALGGRIAVLAGGELQCYGSIDFLQQEYGAQYELKLITGPECKPAEIEALCRRYVPDLQVSTRATEYRLIYYFPKSASNSLEPLSDELETSLTTLGIENWYISVTTLKDIVEKVCKLYEQRFLHKKSFPREYLARSQSLTNLLANLSGSVHGYHLVLYQYLAMFRKMFVVMNRFWIIVLIQIAFPVIFVAIDATNQRSVVTNWPSLALTLDMYSSPNVLVNGNKSDPLVKLYIKQLKSGRYTFTSNISNALIGLTKTEKSLLKRSQVGATFQKDKITVWFNGDPYHSSPVSLSLMLNAVRQHLENSSSTITFYNKPLPYRARTRVAMSKMRKVSGTFPAFVLTALSISVGIFARPLIIERVSKFKARQFHSGLPVFVFWSAALIMDFLLFIIILSAFVIIVYFDNSHYESGYELLALFLLTLCFGVGSLVFIFFITLIMSVPAVCFPVVIGIGLITGLFLTVAVEDVLYKAFPTLSMVLRYMFMISPFYCLGSGLYVIEGEAHVRKACSRAIEQCLKLHNDEKFCEKVTCDTTEECCENYVFFFNFEVDGILNQLFYLLGVAVLLLTLVVLHDSDSFRSVCEKFKLSINRRRKRDSVYVPIKYLTNKGTELHEEYMIVLEDVAKSYRKKVGLHDIFLGLKPYECFGVLGLSGSGKSGIFRLIMGIERPSRGKIWVCGMNPNIQIASVRKLIGHCPQNCGLMDDLTVKEILIMICLIRGIPMKMCKAIGEQMATRCGFKDCMDKYVKTLSSSVKKKVSFAVAIIGDPPILCLDEPTEGMDPASKRMIWDIILKLRAVGKCIILITSSMQECEALCTSAGVLLKGRFECMGLVQKLKEKYTKGYTLTIKLRSPADFEQLHRFITENFDKTTLRRHVRELAVFDVQDSAQACKIYTRLEAAKEELNVDHYTVDKNNLEQMFLNFTTDRHLRF